MLRITDIPHIYDQCENKDLRCLIALPNDSRTYILDDYDEGWDWETEQATYETDLVLVDRDTLVVKRVTFDNDKRILRDENHIRVLEDRIEDRIENRDYFVIDMKSSVIRDQQYVTLTLIDKEYGLKKDLVYRANTLWEKADNNFYVDTKKAL